MSDCWPTPWWEDGTHFFAREDAVEPAWAAPTNSRTGNRKRPPQSSPPEWAGTIRRLSREFQLTAGDALGTHARDELGMSATVTTRPVQADVVSAASFATGAIVPLVVARLAAFTRVTKLVALTSLVTMTSLAALATLGGLGASAGGAGIFNGALRVTVWGAMVMAATAAIGMISTVSVCWQTGFGPSTPLLFFSERFNLCSAIGRVCTLPYRTLTHSARIVKSQLTNPLD